MSWSRITAEQKKMAAHKAAVEKNLKAAKALFGHLKEKERLRLLALQRQQTQSTTTTTTSSPSRGVRSTPGDPHSAGVRPGRSSGRRRRWPSSASRTSTAPRDQTRSTAPV